MKGRARPPVIILGMHRSGTTLITRMLETLGLFVGRRKQRNCEALFFFHLNEWIFSQSGAAWDHPAPVHRILERGDVRALVAEYIRSLMKTPHAAGFLGWGGYLRYRTPLALDIAWGWKDPRNTFTLPLWLDLFPEAKIIHVRRHGVDVASSLRSRGERLLSERSECFRKRSSLYWLRRRRPGFTDSLRCSSLEEGLSLWQEYLVEARGHVRELRERALDIRYEEFLQNPREHLESLSDFCGLRANDRSLNWIDRLVIRDRAYAHRRDPELRAFSQKVAECLRAWGY